MTHVYLHIGSHKTGTSSIQATLFNARSTLLQDGINYLALGANHSIPLYSLFCPEPHLYRLNVIQGVNTEELAARHNETIRARLLAELEKNENGKFIISGEDLSVLPHESVERLRGLLAPYATAITVIVYVREPYDFMVSAAQERIRAGRTLAAVRDKPLLPDYRGRIGKYIEVFGRENVRIRPFVPGSFIGGDLIADFLDAIDAPAALRNELHAVVSNESMSQEAALILDQANQLFPLIEDNRANPARSPALTERIASIKGQPFSLPREAFSHVHQAVDADLAWLREVMGHNPFAQVATRPQEPPELWQDDTLRSLAQLINAMAREIESQ